MALAREKRAPVGGNRDRGNMAPYGGIFHGARETVGPRRRTISDRGNMAPHEGGAMVHGAWCT